MEKLETTIKKKQISLDRLNYSGELKLVIDRLAKSYRIGNPINFSVIDIGYEDCNVFIETSQGKYVAKIFSKSRSQEAIIRYTTIIEEVIKAKVNHPALIKISSDEIIYSDSQANGISMVLMQFINGRTFFELDRVPNIEEQQEIIEQAVKVNNINYHPPCFSDPWEIQNIKAMFKKTKEFIKSKDIKFIEQVISWYREIPVKDLPHCFVHGDFSKTNIIKGNDGRIYIIDFSAANWYPRIQELATIAANLLYDEKNNLSLRDRIKSVLEIYDKLNYVTPREKKHI